MGLRVAVATEDGLEVQHFRHAARFHVYDVDPSGIVLVGPREDPGSTTAVEERAASHQRKLELIRDCGALIVARVGPNALRLIEAQGIAVYESQDPAPDALKGLAAAEGSSPQQGHGTGSS